MSPPRRPQRWHFLAVTVTVAALAIMPGAALAQRKDRIAIQPGKSQVELPDFAPAEEIRSSVLPPLPPAPRTTPYSNTRIEVQSILFRGNSVVEDDALADLARPYEGRTLVFADIETLRDSVTALYWSLGYRTTDVRIPDQEIVDGVVVLEVVEGRLESIQIDGLEHRRPAWLRRRLKAATTGVIDVNQLERALRLLRQDSQITSLQARLEPGTAPGLSTLHVTVVEERPYFASLRLNNHRSPTLGSYGGVIEAGVHDLIGVGDLISVSYWRTEGLDEFSALLEVPLTPWGTQLSFYTLQSWADVVEEPFDELDIESNASTLGVSISQQLYRSLNNSISLFVAGEYRTSESFLTGEAFSFSPGVEDGRARIAVLRVGGDWIYRDSIQVLALRSMVSFGLDALNATKNSCCTPDGQYIAWLGQVQIARRLPFLDSLFLSRFDVQLSNKSLLGLEQFSVGGHASVRGYRENQLVRDQGVAGSVEWQVPLLRRSGGESMLTASAFFDAGRAWNKTLSDPPGNRTLLGLGAGIRYQPSSWLSLRIDWAEPLRRPRDSSKWDLQDTSFYFSLDVSLP